LVVYPDRMRQNLEALGGTVFSGQLLLELTKHDVTREDAYQMVQRNATRVWDEGLDFRTAVLADSELVGKLPQSVLDGVFDLGVQLRNVDKIFRRVFGDAA